MAFNVDFSPIAYSNAQMAETWKDLGYTQGAMLGKAVEGGLTGLLGKTFKPEFEGSKRAWSDKIIKDMWETELQDHPSMAMFDDYEDFYTTMKPQFEVDNKGKVQFRSRTGRDGMIDRLTDWLGTTEEAKITAAQEGIWNRLEDPELHKKFYDEYKRYDEATSPTVMRGWLGAPTDKYSGKLMPLFDKEFWQSGIAGARQGKYVGRNEDLQDFEKLEALWKEVNPGWQDMDKDTQRKKFNKYIEGWDGNTKVETTGTYPKLDDLDWTIGEDGDFQVNPGGLMSRVQGFRTGWDAMNDSAPGHKVPWWRKPAQQAIGAATLGAAGYFNPIGRKGLTGAQRTVELMAGAGLLDKSLKFFGEGGFEQFGKDIEQTKKDIRKTIFPKSDENTTLLQNIFGTPKINAANEEARQTLIQKNKDLYFLLQEGVIDKEEYRKLSKEAVAKAKENIDNVTTNTWYKRQMAKKNALSRWPGKGSDDPETVTYDGKTFTKLVPSKKRPIRDMIDTYRANREKKRATAEDERSDKNIAQAEAHFADKKAKRAYYKKGYDYHGKDGIITTSGKETPGFKAFKERVGIDGATRNVQMPDGTVIKIPAFANKDRYARYIQARKDDTIDSYTSWEEFKKQEKDARKIAREATSRRKIVDVNTGDTYYLPKGANRKRYQKFANFKKRGGDLSWEEFKKNKLYKKEFKDLWGADSNFKLATEAPTADKGIHPVQDLLNDVMTGNAPDDLGPADENPTYDQNRVLPDDEPELHGPLMEDGSFTSEDSLLHTVAEQDTLGNKNNNPGNLKFAGQNGAINSNGFAKFPTMEDGWRALYRQVSLDADRGDTIETFIKGEDGTGGYSEDNQDEYIQLITSRLGVPADTPISELNQQALVTAIGIMEGTISHNEFAPSLESLNPTQKVKDKSDNTKKKVKKSDEILEKAKDKSKPTKGKVDYTPYDVREVSTPRRKI